MSQFGETTLNPGSGGSLLATSTFVNPGDGKSVVMPWSALTYLASGNAYDTTGVFQTIDATHGLPVNVVAGTIAIGAGSAVIGHVIVDSGTVTVGNATLAVTQSGTWTVQQGGAPWSMVGNVASGAADSGNPLKIGGAFNTTQPTVTTGQRVDAQMTARGAQIVATGVDTFHATIDNATIAVTQSGTWALGASSAVIGHVVVDSVGGTVTVAGTVTSNIGTTGGLALDTSVNGLLLAQASATSGEKGPLMQGAVTTAAPTYTTGNTNPLSLTPAGALRVDGSATTQPISGTVTANAGTGTFTVSGTVTGNQGAANTLANAWPVKHTDGTNVMPTGDAPARSIHTTVDNSTLAVTQSGTWTIGAGSALIGQVELSDGTNVIGTGTHPVRTDPTGTTTQPVSLASLPALAAGTNNAGYVTPAVGGATTGATPFTVVSAASNNLTTIKASAGTLWEIIGVNLNTSAVRYVKFFDGSPTMGTTNAIYQIALPTAGTANGAGAARSWPTGLKFASGIYIAITGGIALNDNTAVSANDVALSGAYS